MATILIVDDSAFQRTFLRKTLTGAGFTVLEANNGGEALERTAEENPDVILTDLIMPDLRGRVLLETLQSQGSKIPIVVLTADIQEPVAAECLQLGAVQVLHKPIKPAILIQTLTDVLVTSKAARQEPGDSAS